MIKFPSERPPFYSNVHEKSIRTHRCCGKCKSFDISNYIKFAPRRKWRSAIGTSQILSIPLCGVFVRYGSIRHTKLPVQRCCIPYTITWNLQMGSVFWRHSTLFRCKHLENEATKRTSFFSKKKIKCRNYSPTFSPNLFDLKKRRFSRVLTKPQAPFQPSSFHIRKKLQATMKFKRVWNIAHDKQRMRLI